MSIIGPSMILLSRTTPPDYKLKKLVIKFGVANTLDALTFKLVSTRSVLRKTTNRKLSFELDISCLNFLSCSLDSLMSQLLPSNSWTIFYMYILIFSIFIISIISQSTPIHWRSTRNRSARYFKNLRRLACSLNLKNINSPSWKLPFLALSSQKIV